MLHTHVHSSSTVHHGVIEKLLISQWSTFHKLYHFFPRNSEGKMSYRIMRGLFANRGVGFPDRERKTGLRFANLVACLVVVWLSAATAFAEHNALKRDFLKKYESSAKRLEKFYRRVRIVATRTIQPPHGSKEATTTEKLDFRANGQLMRLDIFQTSGVSVIVANPTRSFLAHRLANEPAFQLDSFGANYQKREDKIIGRSYFPISPYGWMYCPLVDFLQSADLEITRVQEIQQGDETLTRVSYVSHRKVVAGLTPTGWIDLSAKLGWAIRGISAWAEPIKSGSECTRFIIEYNGESDGIPLLSKVVKLTERQPSREVVAQVTYTIDDITAGPIPENEFTPAAIGIDVPDIGARPGFNRFLFLGLIGLVLVLTTILVARHWSGIFGRRSA